MNRRKLLKTIGLSAGVALTAGVVPKEIAAKAELNSVRELLWDELPKYRGFRLKWRGWFPIPNMDAQVGQWIGYNPHTTEGWGFHVYSACPGAVYKFWDGQIFDCSPREGQEYPKYPNTPENMKRYQDETFQKLIKYIDEHYKELTTRG